MTRRTGPWLFLLLCFVLPAAHAEEERTEADPGELTLKQIYAGKRFTRSVPNWSWRPGHDELIRVDRRPLPGKSNKPHRVLLARHPTTGAERVLLDFTALESLVAKAAPAMRRIGRGGPRSHVWRADGKALVAGVRGDLVWVDLEADTTRRLTNTKTALADVRVSPDGTQVSFSRGNELWAVPTKAGEPRQLTTGGSETLRNGTLDWVYPEEFGFKTAAWWASDGSRVAYLQLDESAVPEHRLPKVLGKRGNGRVMRYPRAGDANPKARLGVVQAAGGDTTWLDLGDPEYVVRVAWTPDGARVLVVTLDRAQQTLRLLSCDPATGASAVLLTEADAAWVDAPPAPRFQGGAFFWRTHRDGTTRYERITLDAKATKVVSREAITPAGYQALALHHVDPKAKRAVFSANPHGSGTPSVYVGWGDAKPALAPFVATPTASVTASMNASGTFAVVSTSDVLTPTTRELWRADGELLKTIGHAGTDRLTALDLAEPESIDLPIDGGLIRMRLWKPADLDEQLKANPKLALPMIVQVYGGPGSQTVRNRFGRGPLLMTHLTQRGYLVLQIDGRGTGGQGAAFRRTVYRQLGVLEIADQARGARHVAQRPYVDGKRIGIWGWSYGGTMACNGVTMQPEVFRVAVAVAPVTDWRLYDTIYTERYMNTPKANPGGYKASASITHAKALRGRLLLMHGLGDDNVHVQNTYQLAEALIRAKRTTFDVMTYPRRGHGIGGAAFDLYTRLVAYFDRHL